MRLESCLQELSPKTWVDDVIFLAHIQEEAWAWWAKLITLLYLDDWLICCSFSCQEGETSVGGVFVLWLWKWLVASLHLEKLSWSKLYPSLMSYINCRIHLQAWLKFSPAPKCNSVPFQSLIQPQTQMLWWSGQGSDDIWIQTQMWFRPGLECDLVQNPKSLPSWTQYGIWSQNLMWFGPWPKYNSVLDPSVIWSWTQMRSPLPQTKVTPNITLVLYPIWCLVPWFSLGPKSYFVPHRSCTQNNPLGATEPLHSLILKL